MTHPWRKQAAAGVAAARAKNTRVVHKVDRKISDSTIKENLTVARSSVASEPPAQAPGQIGPE